jgi:hypothetical protein
VSELTDAAADHAAAAVTAVVERSCRTQTLSFEAGHFVLSVLQPPECHTLLARRQQHIPLLLLLLVVVLPLLINAADRAAAVAVVERTADIND